MKDDLTTLFMLKNITISITSDVPFLARRDRCLHEPRLTKMRKKCDESNSSKHARGKGDEEKARGSEGVLVT
jgi:hypothetical protein